MVGGMALGGGASWLLAVLLTDAGGLEVDRRVWVERGTGLGATAGFAALIFRVLGVA